MASKAECLEAHRRTWEARYPIVLAMRAEGASFREIGTRIGVGPERARQLHHKAQRAAITNENRHPEVATASKVDRTDFMWRRSDRKEIVALLLGSAWNIDDLEQLLADCRAIEAYVWDDRSPG